MLTAEIDDLKLELISWIQGLSDEPTLQILLSLKYTEESDPAWDALREANREAIMIGVQQAKNGEGISSEEFWGRLKGI